MILLAARNGAAWIEGLTEMAKSSVMLIGISSYSIFSMTGAPAGVPGILMQQRRRAPAAGRHRRVAYQ
jgi:hypothetical protein